MRTVSGGTAGRLYRLMRRDPQTRQAMDEVLDDAPRTILSVARRSPTRPAPRPVEPPATDTEIALADSRATALETEATGFELSAADEAQPPQQRAFARRQAGLVRSQARTLRSFVIRQRELQARAATPAVQPADVEDDALVTADELRARYMWVPMSADRAARRVLVNRILRERQVLSRAFVDALAATPDNPELATYDTLLIGAGVHSATVATAINRADPDHRMLMLEASDVVSANFGLSGDVFAINSRNDEASDDPLFQGRGNINPLAGPVQLPDLSGARWPSARTLGDAVTISAHTSGSRIALGAEVVSVRELPAGNRPARYQVTFRDRRTNRELRVFANQLVVGTGLGQARFDFRDAATNAFVAQEVASFDATQRTRAPRVMTSEQAIRLAAQSRRGRDLFRRAPGQEREPITAIVGFGDSARVVAEWLTGRAPDETYDGDGRLDRAQRGEIGAIDWVVGNDGPETCEEYLQGAPERNLAGTRDRYADLAGPIRAEKIRLVRGRLVAVRPIEEGADQGRVALDYQLANGTTSTRVVDRVILSTGFRTQTQRVLRDVLPRDLGDAPLEDSDLVEVVRDGNVGLGKRVNGQDVYLVGPAAGSNGIVDAGDLRRVNENRASIFNLGPRSERLGTRVLARFPTRVGGRATSAIDAAPRTSLTQVNREDRIFAPLAAAPEGTLTLDVGRAATPLLLKSVAADVLEQFRFPGYQRVDVIARRGENGGLELSVPGLDQRSVQSIAEAFSREPELVDVLRDALAGSSDPITFSARTRPDRAAGNGQTIVTASSVRVSGL